MKQGNAAFYNEAQVRGNRCVFPTAAATGATAAALVVLCFAAASPLDVPS
jgi:hypothetical protein